MDEARGVWRKARYEGSMRQGGEHMAFYTSGRNEDGKFRLVFTLPPKKRGPTSHAHPGESETVEVVSGSVRIWRDQVVADYGPGEVVVIGAGVQHEMYNPSDVPVVMRVTYDGTSMEDVFVPMAVALSNGESLLRAFARMIVFVAENRPTRPRSKVEPHILGMIGGVFRLFGFRAHEPVRGWDC